MDSILSDKVYAIDSLTKIPDGINILPDQLVESVKRDIMLIAMERLK